MRPPPAAGPSTAAAALLTVLGAAAVALAATTASSEEAPRWRWPLQRATGTGVDADEERDGGDCRVCSVESRDDAASSCASRLPCGIEGTYALVSSLPCRPGWGCDPSLRRTLCASVAIL